MCFLSAGILESWIKSDMACPVSTGKEIFQALLDPVFQF
ncbi:hypothetical protein LEP1GSC017_3877 [Leptospira meyeri serovar Hardjo str. Went 5]|nr:hypothetical protein LEP1GSC017_3877 [Leptospira meyeri serovar Hardjo str. Went 5]EMJ86344.1 hypothetical protein LEP1GSC196_3073 [Leptospira meyeri serovar Semaranga str. Veldrot Semarang 173]